MLKNFLEILPFHGHILDLKEFGTVALHVHMYTPSILLKCDFNFMHCLTHMEAVVRLTGLADRTTGLISFH